MDSKQSKKIQKIIEAFQNEKPNIFEVDSEKDIFHVNGKIGIRAHNKNAMVKDTSTKKKAYYLEGDPWEMGYLMGQMAEPEIEQMCTKFNSNVIFDFIGDKWFKNKRFKKLIGECLEILIYCLSTNIYPDIPNEYMREMQGMLEGCRKVNPRTKVSWSELWLLNVGIDALLAFIYTGKLPIKIKLPFKIKPKYFKIPIMCNGFSVFGKAAEGNNHFLGRDFMFPTADVFQDVACMIIQKPDGKLPFVNMTAPGMIGCVTGMNNHSVGIGVDIIPSGNCNPSRPGLNSLLLNRYCIENGKSCNEAVDLMEQAQRGVSWGYIIADYENKKSCIVEAGCKTDDTDFASLALDFIRECFESEFNKKKCKKLFSNLPDKSFLNLQKSTEFRKGMMVRWNDFSYPEKYLAFNKMLFKLFGKKYRQEDFTERGYINKTWKDKNCPCGYYFAPQRESDKNLVLVSNAFVIPEMRLFAMHPVSNLVGASNYDDIQWRYDELNNELLSELYPEPDRKLKPLSFDDAKRIIDFLAPYPDAKFPDYYNPSLKYDWRKIKIEGSVNLMDLKNCVMHSHYGYYGDEWVKVTLPNYL
jgi:hypothetical protein